MNMSPSIVSNRCFFHKRYHQHRLGVLGDQKLGWSIQVCPVQSVYLNFLFMFGKLLVDLFFTYFRSGSISFCFIDTANKMGNLYGYSFHLENLAFRNYFVISVDSTISHVRFCHWFSMIHCSFLVKS